MSFIDKAMKEAQKAMDKHGPKVQEGLDKAKTEAQKAAHKHGPKIQEGIDKVAAKADERTGGKHHDKIAQARGKVSQGFDTATSKLDESAAKDQGPAYGAPGDVATEFPIADPPTASDSPTIDPDGPDPQQPKL